MTKWGFIDSETGDFYEVTETGMRERFVIKDPITRAAIDEVFAAPGEFGPAKGYYGPDTDHFIELLRGRLTSAVPVVQST